MVSIFIEKYPESAAHSLTFETTEDGNRVVSDAGAEIVFHGLEWNSFFSPRFSGEYEKVLPFSLVSGEFGVEWAVFDKCANYLTSFV